RDRFLEVTFTINTQDGEAGTSVADTFWHMACGMEQDNMDNEPTHVALPSFPTGEVRCSLCSRQVANLSLGTRTARPNVAVGKCSCRMRSRTFVWPKLKMRLTSARESYSGCTRGSLLRAGIVFTPFFLLNYPLALVSDANQRGSSKFPLCCA